MGINLNLLLSETNNYCTISSPRNARNLLNFLTRCNWCPFKNEIVFWNRNCSESFGSLFMSWRCLTKLTYFDRHPNRGRLTQSIVKWLNILILSNWHGQNHNCQFLNYIRFPERYSPGKIGLKMRKRDTDIFNMLLSPINSV